MTAPTAAPENLDNVTLIVTFEFSETRETPPAGYFLANWSAHAPATRAIRQAIAGRPSEFWTPRGTVFVRRAR